VCGQMLRNNVTVVFPAPLAVAHYSCCGGSSDALKIHPITKRPVAEGVLLEECSGPDEPSQWQGVVTM
jgi:hypothetical protein